MLYYINIFGIHIPGYAACIGAGLFVANLLAAIAVRKAKLDINDFIIFEAYILLGGIIGAKLLYLWVSRGDIDWSRIFELEYLSMVMQGGFVFYGGLFGAAAGIFAAAKAHKIDVKAYMQRLLFLFPLVHAFGRVGCFCAGCCYGMEYGGIFAVTFPEGAIAPAGISLFPVQLFESALLLVIAAVVFFIQRKSVFWAAIGYAALYGAVRFGVEFLRGDALRGAWQGLSTSQWISIALFAAAVIAAAWRVFGGRLLKSGRA